MMFFVQSIFAQVKTISGTVTEQGSGLLLPGVSVVIEGTSIGGVTDFDGKYSFEVEEAEGKKLTFSFVGFKTGSVALTNESNVVDFVMQADLLNLDEVVVTGSSVGVNKRTLGNSISTLKADDITGGAATQIDQAISGKVTGALVQQNSGDPAGGISIRLRGASTIAGSSDPLYIVDGIIINNSSNQLVDLGGSSQNRLVDINPNDVERMEIIKGAAAAAIYGSRASNGVVQIFTKKGKTGKTRFNFSTNVKMNTLRKEIDYNTVDLAWENPFDNTNLNTVPVTRYNYQDDFFGTGYGTENYLSMSGGTEKTSYYVSASQLSNQGIIKSTDFKRYGFKVNVKQEATDWLDVNASLSYTKSNSNDIPNGGINSAYGAITGYVFSDNSVNPQPNESGVYPVTSLLVPRTNPLEAVNRFEFGQKVNRIITSIGLDAKITERFSANYTLGMDYFNQSATGYIPVGNTSPQGDGFAQRADLSNFQYNSDLNFVYKIDINENITSTTVLGGSWQYQDTQAVSISATGLPPIVQTASSGSIVNQGEGRSQISFWGGFLQESVSFKNKLYLNAALRMDGASSFGLDQRNQLYAKGSISYVISEEEFWNDTFGSSFNTFKVRTSWGQAGNLTALTAFQRHTLLNPSAINGSPSLIPSPNQGDEEIAPERMDEFEIGFDAGFVNNRLGLEFTYYKQNVTDLLLPRELAPSTGYATRIENVGDLKNTGFEILLRGVPIRNENFNWDITATFSKNENVITKVAGGGQFALPGSFATNYVIEGESLGVFYRQYYARDTDGNIALDANGYPYTAKDANGTALKKVIGDPNPDWFGSITNEFSYKNFALRFQLDAVQGFDVFNWNRRLMDNVIFGGGANVGEELLGNQIKGYGRAQAGIFEEFVEDGSFVKLRELAFSYKLMLASESINSITFSFVGRNMISWDNYSGWDPEVNTPGQSNGVRGFDFAAVPIPSTYQLGVNISF